MFNEHLWNVLETLEQALKLEIRGCVDAIKNCMNEINTLKMASVKQTAKEFDGVVLIVYKNGECVIVPGHTFYVGDNYLVRVHFPGINEAKTVFTSNKPWVFIQCCDSYEDAEGNAKKLKLNV